MKYLIAVICFFGGISAQAQCTGYMMTINSTNPTCFGFSDGSLTASTTGGNGGETWNIEDALGSQISTLPGVNFLLEGWYFVEVTDMMGCYLIDSVFIDAPDEMVAQLTVDSLNCYGDASGSIVVDTVFNYTGTYNQISYFINPDPNSDSGTNNTVFDSIPAGNYSLTINDENGCSVVVNALVEQPDSLYFWQFGSEACTSGTNGVVYMAAMGGIPDYTYLWTNLTDFSNTGNTTWGGLSCGDCFEGHITDANGCTIVDTICVGYAGMIEDDINVQLYPNPANDQLFVEVTESASVLQIFSMHGQEVQLENLVIGKNVIDISELPSGIYMVVVKSDKGIAKERLVVE